MATHAAAAFGGTRAGAGAAQTRTPRIARPVEGTGAGPSPLRKAALLIVSLEEAEARALLAHLDRAQTDALNAELTALTDMDPAEQRAALDEFLDLGRKRLRFVFEDVPHMADNDLRLAFRGDDLASWALALAGASRQARQKVLGALPPAWAEALRRALAAIGPFRLDDAEAAQAEIAEHLRRLHDEGRITLPPSDGPEGLVA